LRSETIKRVAIAGATAVMTLNIWTGAPLAAMWIGSEIAAMATDLAESLGAAIGLSLLFGLPLLPGLLITFGATYGILLLQGSAVALLELLLAAHFYGRVYRHAVRTGLLARYSAESAA